MSAKATQADDSTELPTDVHGKLADRLQTLRDCVDCADDSYSMEVEQTSEEHGLWSVIIDSDDWIGNEGEIGDMRFHIILGPQGGLQLAKSDRTLVEGRRDYVNTYDTKGRAWRRLKGAIKDAK